MSISLTPMIAASLRAVFRLIPWSTFVHSAVMVKMSRSGNSSLITNLSSALNRFCILASLL